MTSSTLLNEASKSSKRKKAVQAEIKQKPTKHFSLQNELNGNQKILMFIDLFYFKNIIFIKWILMID